MRDRRDFLTRVGAFAAAVTLDVDDVRAAAAPPSDTWDLSWVEKITSAPFKMVVNAEDIAYGTAIDYAETFLDHFREAHGTTDVQTRPVVVFRRLGTPLALDDEMWERYGIGEDSKITDTRTRKPAIRNIYKPRLLALQARGLIVLVCNIALGNWSARAAKRTNKNTVDVLAEARGHLVPGAILVPSGVFALIRAQNAGCAYMPGS